MPTRCNLVIEFIIPQFIEGSTCFERHTAHHQELQTVVAAFGLYAHVVTGRYAGWMENKFWNNKFYYKFASCSLFLLI
jgi:hypothetical protein